MNKTKSFNQASFVGKSREEVRKKYKIYKLIGEGAYSQVFLAKHRITGLKRCVKAISKDNFTKDANESIMNEIQILKELDHPHIVKIFEYFETESELFLITEFLEGGELFSKIEERSSFSEKDAKIIMKQVLGTVAYLHKHDITHRDLKPENIMLVKTEENDLFLKIIDFGTSKRVLPQERLTSRMGTPYYIAPEVLNGDYGKSCDIWSCGVIFYILLCGYPPFNGSTDTKIMERIKRGKFIFPEEEWDQISKQAKDLITKMLTLDRFKRPTAEELLKHEWFSTKQEKINLIENQKYIENLYKFNIKSKILNAIFLFFLNYYETTEDKKELLKAFEEIDVNGNGVITKDELLAYYKEIHPLMNNEEKVLKVLENFDFNNNEGVDFSEFCLANFDFKKAINEEKLKEIFRIIDLDGNGIITEDELKEFFHFSDSIKDKEFIKEIIKEVDQNNDGQISYEEFKGLIKTLL
jgi:calcium-dependent protein kinase